MLAMYTLWKPGVDGSGGGGVGWGAAQWCMHPKCYNLRSKT